MGASAQPLSCILRADADGQIGYGHLVRMLALAEALAKRGVACSLATQSSIGDQAIPCLRLEKGITRREEAIQLARRAPDVIVADLYAPTSTDTDALKGIGAKLVVVYDGDGAGPPSDLIVRPNLVHGGGEQILLRSQFCSGQVRETRRQLDAVVVCLGGGDPTGLWPRLVSWLPRIVTTRGPVAGPARIHLVIGPGVDASTLACVRAACADLPVLSLHADVTEMAAMLRSADAAILAAGTLLYEALATQTPAAFLGLSDDQVREVRFAADRGAAIDLGHGAALEPSTLEHALVALAPFEVRRTMASAAAGLVDGHGCERVAAAIESLCR